MFTLYWEYLAGSIVVQAMLEAIGTDYRLQYVDMAADEHRGQAFLRCNPTGRVPALALADGQTIGETAAIVVILGETFPKVGLVPQPGDSDRALFLLWLNVMSTSGYMTAARMGHPERYARSGHAIEQVGEKACADYDDFFDTMENAISGASYFLAGRATALDFYLAMLTEWHADKQVLFRTRPSLERLCNAVSENRGL